MSVTMPKRQAAFRDDFRLRIARFYNGPLHVFMIFAIGIATIWYCARQIVSPAWYEWLIIPAAFLVGNIFEWWMHHFIMHRPVKGFGNVFMAIYTRHTLAHHQFFTDHEPSIDNLRDFRIVFFPPYALATFILLSIPPAALLMYLGLRDMGGLLLCTNTFLYLNYEFFHFCCHVKDERIVRHVPFVNTIRRHHIAHHDTHQMMERNFNLTYPLADWLFGTSDLDRGALGHLFNGNSNKHVKPKPRKILATSDDPNAGVARTGSTAE